MKPGKTLLPLAATMVAAALVVAYYTSKAATPTASPALAKDTTTQVQPATEGVAPQKPAAAPAPAAPSAASEEQIAELSKPSGGPEGGLYTCKDGSKVDPATLKGWKAWRALACERCHGDEQQGLVGPALVVSLHRLTKEEFHTTITNGRLEKGMPPFAESKMAMDNWEGLYAYLKGRADGVIKPGRLSALEGDAP